MAAPYIPNKDADFATWLLNFATLIAASPATYGLVAGDAAAISAQNSAFQAAYTLAIDPGTRTPATIAAKDAARAVATAVARGYAINIRNNAGVSNLDKVALGLTVPDLTPTPVPPPATAPALILVAATPLQHELQFRDSISPLLKRKPFGVIGLELFRSVGTVPATDPAQATYLFTATKTPFIAAGLDAAMRGKSAVYWGRWVNRSGPSGIAASGPWSEALATYVI